MGRVAGIACAMLLAFVATPATALSQTDYRNLDDGRPVLTEDAFVVDLHAFEFLAPLAFDADVSGTKRYLTQPELEYGVLPNTQLGLKLPVGVVDSGGTSTFGLGGIQLSGLYNINNEGLALPAVSARLDLLLPAGAVAYEGTLATFKLIATRTFGLVRLHLNGAWTFGRSSSDFPSLEPPPRWFAGAAVDYTFFRNSLLLVGDLTASQEYEGAPTGVTVGGGVRWQWTPTLVLDAGVARRLTGNAGPDLELTAGLSHAFAIRGLMPAARPPGDSLRSSGAAATTVRAEQFYYPGSFNWRFLARYPEVARLFNAFDYGHATLYENLLTVAPARLSQRARSRVPLPHHRPAAPPAPVRCGRGRDRAGVREDCMAGKADVRLGACAAPAGLRRLRRSVALRRRSRLIDRDS